jgi:streptomycin 6-kinase
MPTKISERLASQPNFWLAELDTQIDKATRLWNLHLLEAFEPGGYTSWTAPGLQADREIVLKIGEAKELCLEAQALREWDGAGAVNLLAYEKGMLLLEKLTPAQIEPSPEELAELCVSLWRAPKAHYPLVYLEIDKWLRILEHKEPLILKALSAYSPQRNEKFLLHGDLHPENMFRSQTLTQLKALDPCPRIGPRAFELEPLLRKTLDKEDYQGTKELIGFFSEQFEIKTEEILYYALVRALWYAHFGSTHWQPRIDGILQLIFSRT